MKSLLTLLTCLFILSPNVVLSETIEDLVQREGIYYKKFSDVPFTGKTTGEIQGTYRNGKMHGLWVSYWDNGQLLGKGNWKDGKMHGLWVSYWDNGQLMGKGNWKDGKKDGLWFIYNRDGTVDEKYTGTFKNGVKVK